MKRHESRINLENLLRIYHTEHNFAGVRAVFRSVGAIDVYDEPGGFYGPSYGVAFPRYGTEGIVKWVEWDNVERAIDVLDCLLGTVQYCTPQGT